jgi:hypothetical protein
VKGNGDKASMGRILYDKLSLAISIVAVVVANDES